jgi:chromate transporter
MSGGRILVQLGVLFGGLSLISIGGANVLLPEIHRQVVETHAWLDDATFARLFAISQAAPGPNIMLASIIGWHIAGLAGLLVATLGILIPPAIGALIAGRGVRRWSEHRAIHMLTAGLVPLALGLMLASGVVASHSARGGLLGYAVTASVGLAVFATNRNPLVSMALGTVAFVALSFLGLGVAPL